MNKNHKIYVAGHKGMIGSFLLEELKNRGYTNTITKESDQIDLRDKSKTMDFLERAQPDYVFLIAGKVGGIQANINNPASFLYDNIMIASNVIEISRIVGVKKLLYLGSSCIYPRDCPQPMKEEHLLGGFLEPTNEGYALAKISGMKLCEYYNQQHGTNYLSLIPCNLYGEGDHFETEGSHVISALLYRMHQAKIQGDAEVVVWGTGNTRREFLFVDDFSKAILHFVGKVDAKQMQGFVNVGSGKDQSIRDLAYMVK